MTEEPRTLLALAASPCVVACSDPAARPSFVDVRAGSRTFRVELATTPAELHRGLTGRAAVPADAGMLFILPAPGRHCFWMKDTPTPLSIAFIDDAGQVITLAEMAPLDQRQHCASGPARYALEVNHGLLTAAGDAGSSIGGLPRGG